MAYIMLNNIQKAYGGKKNRTPVLDGLEMEVAQGEMVAVMGKSGCGKSTLLNIMGGLDWADSGEYVVDGVSVSGLQGDALAKFRKEHIGFVVQNFALIDDMTVYKNIALPLRYHGKSQEYIHQTIERLTQELEITGKEEEFARDLSGGERQRVAIARAIACEPDIILADEPTGALDEKTSAEILKILCGLNKKGKTIIIVTHEKSVACRCHKIYHMADGKMEGAPVITSVE